MIAKKIYLIPIFLFLISLIFFPIFGNYAINDDWIFYRQILQTLSTGDFTISSLIDPSFIFQFLLGYFWSSVFGLSFGNLRILSILAGVGFFLISLKILKLPKLSPISLFFFLSTIVFNPLIFYSSLSFMTEIYFLFLISASLYFLIKDLQSSKMTLNFNFWLGVVFAGFAFLQRQYGIVLFVSYLVSMFFIFKKHNLPKKFFYQKSLITIFVLSLYFIIYLLWPRFDNSIGQVNLLSNLGSLENIFVNIQKTPQTLPYFIFFLSPLLIPLSGSVFKEIWSKKQVVKKVLFFLTLSTSTYFLFIYNIFALGNIFYLEGFSLKSDYRPTASLGNLAIFKLIIALLISYLISVLVVSLYSYLKNFKFKNRPLPDFNQIDLFLVLSAFLSFILIFLGNDFYDRYLLPSIFYLTLFLGFRFSKNFEEIKVSSNKFYVLFLCLWISLSLFLNYDFFKTQHHIWDIASKIQVEQDVYDSLYVDDIHAKFKASLLEPTFTGNEKLFFSPRDSVCFVQKYTINPETNFLLVLDRYFQKFVENPRIFESKKKDISRVTKNLKNLLHNERYFSPLTWVVGGEVYIGGYCFKEK